MHQVPRGYAIVPVQPVTRGLPVRRTIVLFAAVGMVWTWFLNNPTGVSADSVGGNPTPPGVCVGSGTPWTLYSGSVAGLASISIRYKITLHGSGDNATVTMARWTSQTGFLGPLLVLQKPWDMDGDGFADAEDATWFVDGGDKGTTLVFQPGSTGTYSYSVAVLGYSVTSCVTIDNVVVSRTPHSGPQVTPPPGGGGVAPTPTPASEPTAPAAPTAIADGTPGPGTECFVDREGDERCYPPPPDGWCWHNDGDDVTLIECESPSAPPSPPPAGPCDGKTWCYDGFVGTGVPLPGANGGCSIAWCFAGTPQAEAEGVANASFVAGHDYEWHMRIETTRTSCGTFQAGVFFSEIQSRISGVTGTPPGSFDWIGCAPADRHWNQWGGTFHVDSVCTGDCSGEAYITAQSGEKWDVYAWFTDLDAPPPTPSPDPGGGEEDDPTLPPNWCGVTGATCPPAPAAPDINVDVDICEDDPTAAACDGIVNICAEHPGIAACMTFGPPPPNSGGNGGPSASGAVGNGVGECTPSGSPKPGTLPIEDLVTPKPDGNIFEEIGTHVGNVPRIAGNGVKGAVNIGVDYLVPGECMQTIVTDFTDEVKDRQPFAAYFSIRDAIDGSTGTEVTAPGMIINGAEVDVNDAFAAVGEATAPYSGILQLIPWLIGGLLIMRKVMGTVGAGEGGG